MHHHDFTEAVGAIFLKSDKLPEWSDKSIDIPDEVISKYFEPIEDEFRRIDFATYR